MKSTTDTIETTGICDMGLSTTLTSGQDKDDYQESLSIEVDIMNNCSEPFGVEDEDGVAVVEAIEVAEVAKTAILGVSGDEDVLINAPSQAATGSHTSSSGG